MKENRGEKCKDEKKCVNEEGKKQTRKRKIGGKINGLREMSQVQVAVCVVQI